MKPSGCMSKNCKQTWGQQKKKSQLSLMRMTTLKTGIILWKNPKLFRFNLSVKSKLKPRTFLKKLQFRQTVFWTACCKRQPICSKVYSRVNDSVCISYFLNFKYYTKSNNCFIQPGSSEMSIASKDNYLAFVFVWIQSFYMTILIYFQVKDWTLYCIN